MSSRPAPLRLAPLRALGQGLSGLRQQPGLQLGFSAAACGVHLLGWALFGAAEGQASGVLAALLHGLGVVLYAGSLVWLIEGLSRAGLAVGSGRRLTPSDLYRWHGRCSRRVACGVINLLAALALAALVSFVAWSLVVFLLPGLSLVPAALGLALCLAVAMSQLFNPCLVLERALSPSQAFRRGVQLLERHWLGQLGLLTLLTAILLLPPLLGLLAEALLEGLGVVVTGVALVTVLPLLANTVTAAYLQLLPEFDVSQSGR